MSADNSSNDTGMLRKLPIDGLSSPAVLSNSRRVESIPNTSTEQGTTNIADSSTHHGSSGDYSLSSSDKSYHSTASQVHNLKGMENYIKDTHRFSLGVFTESGAEEQPQYHRQSNLGHIYDDDLYETELPRTGHSQQQNTVYGNNELGFFKSSDSIPDIRKASKTEIRDSNDLVINPINEKAKIKENPHYHASHNIEVHNRSQPYTTQNQHAGIWFRTASNESVNSQTGLVVGDANANSLERRDKEKYIEELDGFYDIEDNRAPASTIYLFLLLSILVPPFWLFIAVGYVDDSYGEIPKFVKILAGVLTLAVTIMLIIVLAVIMTRG